jgi:hypothetical protein
MKPTNKLGTIARRITVCMATAFLTSACGDGTEPEKLAGPAKPHTQRDTGDADDDANEDDEDQEANENDDENLKLDAASDGVEDDPDADAGDPESPPPSPEGLPAGFEKVAGIEFFQRIIGKWSGITSNTPTGFDFPMAVDIAVSNEGLLFGKYELDADNNVLWGFNIETYNGKDVLAYRNGGYLFGLRRDSRARLVEHDSKRGFYRFCAVLEHGLKVDGCNYIDATYTFSAPDRMVFEVKTHSGELHVHWEAKRVQPHTLPNPFPATIKSQGNGSAHWPAAAGID